MAILAGVGEKLYEQPFKGEAFMDNNWQISENNEQKVQHQQGGLVTLTEKGGMQSAVDVIHSVFACAKGNWHNIESIPCAIKLEGVRITPETGEFHIENISVGIKIIPK